MNFENLMQKRKNLKHGLRNRKQLFATWTSLGDPQITEVFATVKKSSFVGIDIEHGTIDFKTSQRIIAAAQAGGTCCLPRIDSHSMPMIKRLLDSGADGLIIPMVNTSEEAEQLIEWIKYPPQGKRSYGINRAQNYGHNFLDYTTSWNQSSSIIFQIESIQGVKNIDKILAFDEVDAVMVGPYDLSGSLGIPGQLEHPDLLEATKVVIDAAKKFNKGCGTQIVEPNQVAIKKSIDAGNTFAVLSSDIFLLWKWAENVNKLLQES